MATYYCNSGNSYTVSSKQDIIDLYDESLNLKEGILGLVIENIENNGLYAVLMQAKDSSYIQIGNIDAIVP